MLDIYGNRNGKDLDRLGVAQVIGLETFRQIKQLIAESDDIKMVDIYFEGGGAVTFSLIQPQVVPSD